MSGADLISSQPAFSFPVGSCKEMCDGHFSSGARGRRLLPTARHRRGHRRAIEVTVA